MSPEVAKALNVFLQVILYASSWFIGWVSILGVIVIYRKMKREFDKEKRKVDEIIVKRNEEKEKSDLEISTKTEELKQLEKRIMERKLELGEAEAATIPEEEIKPIAETIPEEEKKDPKSAVLTPATPPKQARAKAKKS